MDLSLEKRFAKRRLQMTDFLPSTTISPLSLPLARSLARYFSLSPSPLSLNDSYLSLPSTSPIVWSLRELNDKHLEK